MRLPAGVLDSHFVDVGQEVYEGQLLGRLRNDQLAELQKKAQADLDQAQALVTKLNSKLLAAQLENSRATADQVRAHNEIGPLEKEYTRQKTFWNQGITPRLTYEKAEQDYLAAKREADTQDAAASRAKDRLAELEGELDAANHAIAQANEALDRAKSQASGAELHSPRTGWWLRGAARPAIPSIHRCKTSSGSPRI